MRALGEGDASSNSVNATFGHPRLGKKYDPIFATTYDLGAEVHSIADCCGRCSMRYWRLSPTVHYARCPSPNFRSPNCVKRCDSLRKHAMSARSCCGCNHRAPVQVARSRCSADATYWITGGLGALGCETARWLVRRGAKHLVLSGRRPPNVSAVNCIRELENLGVSIRVFQADANAREQMQFVYDRIQKDMPPLRGVVHAAGALHDAVLLNSTLGGRS